MKVRPSLAAPPAPILALAAALSAASCAGGPKHVSEITPAVAERVSGAWVLNEAESDDPEQAMPRARPGQEGPGVAGGRPGGGRPGAVRPGGSGDPAAMQAVRRMATVVPRRLDISLSDSAVIVSYPREEPWLLPFGSEVKRELGEDLEVEARADWENGRLVVTRSVSEGGRLSETYMPSVDGMRLTVAVELSVGGMRGGVEFRRVYDPAPRPGAGSPR